jgi:hypothetical protein
MVNEIIINNNYMFQSASEHRQKNHKRIKSHECYYILIRNTVYSVVRFN